MTEEHGEQSQPGPMDKQGSPGAAAKLLRNLVFLPWVQYPPLPRVPDLSDPTSFKWNQGKDSAGEDDFDYDTSLVSHLFISSPVGTKDSTSRVGAWLMLPTSSSGKVETLKSSDTVMLYLHGNASNRSQPHRIALYKGFLSLGYYVLAIDYRGFGERCQLSSFLQLFLTIPTYVSKFSRRYAAMAVILIFRVDNGFLEPFKCKINVWPRI